MLLLSQSFFICLYVAFRYYLTFRVDGTMNIVFVCKTFTMVIVATLFSIICFVFLENRGNTLVIIILSFTETISLSLLIAATQRNRLQENKLNQRTICIYFVLTISSNVLWFIFFYFDPDFPNIHVILEFDNIEEFKNMQWIFMLFLSVSLLNPFFTIFIDDKLRRTFFEMFHLPRYCCLCNDRELLAPLLPEQEPRPQHNVYNEPHQVPEAQPR